MKQIRLATVLIAIGLMTVGYAASQFAYFNQASYDWARAIDQPSVKDLALILFIAIIALTAAPQAEEKGN